MEERGRCWVEPLDLPAPSAGCLQRGAGSRGVFALYEFKAGLTITLAELGPNAAPGANASTT